MLNAYMYTYKHCSNTHTCTFLNTHVLHEYVRAYHANVKWEFIVRKCGKLTIKTYLLCIAGIIRINLLFMHGTLTHNLNLSLSCDLRRRAIVTL